MLWGLSAAAALIYWVLSLSEGHSWLRSGVKGLAVAPLAILALTQGAGLLALALILCSLGDVILSRPGERAFLGGLIAFALGHLAWITVIFAVAGPSVEVLLSPLRLLLLIALLALAVILARLMLPRAGDLQLPVTGYIAIIMLMGTTALAAPGQLFLAGAVLFVASDALLGLQTFVLEKGTGRERLANALIWPLYWGAIVLLTLGALGGAAGLPSAPASG